MQHHTEIIDYFNTRGVSVIFLFRRNLLRRMISVLANLYDRDAKLLNGTHKSHVHSPHEVSLSLYLGFQLGTFFLSFLPNGFICKPFQMVSGRDTCKVQACTQCNIADTQSEASRRDDCQSFGVLQEHPAHHSVLRGHS
jgi:hypothetical protein